MLLQGFFAYYYYSDYFVVGGSTSASSILKHHRRNKPENRAVKEYISSKLRPKIIRIVYASLALPDLVERAKKEDIWILKATEDMG